MYSTHIPTEERPRLCTHKTSCAYRGLLQNPYGSTRPVKDMPSRHCTPTTQSQESTRLNHFWVQLACLQFGFKVWEFVFPSFQVSILHTLAMCSCGYVDMSLSLWLQEAWGQPSFESSNHQRHALKARSTQGRRTVQARDLQVPQNYMRT